MHLFKKINLFLFGVIFLHGCSSTSNKFDPASLQQSESAVLISTCDENCKDAIKTKYSIQTGILSPYNILVSEIYEIDGVRGQNSWNGTTMYNSVLDYSYNLKLPAGEHSFRVGVNYYRSFDRTGLPFKINLVTGHGYFIGRLLKETFQENVGPGYVWTPVVYDIVEKQLVFPTENMQWYGEATKSNPVIILPPVKK